MNNPDSPHHGCGHGDMDKDKGGSVAGPSHAMTCTLATVFEGRDVQSVKEHGLVVL